MRKPCWRLRSSIRELAPDDSVVELGSMSEYVAATLATSRIVTALLGAFAALAMFPVGAGVALGLVGAIFASRTMTAHIADLNE